MNKTRVNLFSASLLPPKQRLTFTHLVAAVVAVVGLSVLLYGFSWYQVNQLKQQHRQASQAKEQQSQLKEQLEIQIAQRMPNSELVAQVELQAQRLELKKLLKDELAHRTALISQGYSPILTDLAAVSDGSVWLSRIYFNQQHIEFEGFGQQPYSIPLWIDRLKTADTLKGFAFAAMTMDRGEDQPLAFKLTSTPALSAAKGIK
ncbi:fimbrial assembly protein [Shewanella aestuarii]|uniref:Fimbrial assembly protein n=1 Tax=Shewanella aestuarii TaxID=1028752 RepID=A0A6G9QHK4_9GAMM|nr:fimbrial assembly protein [Shewanella aestuarii]QIR13359.1 fimbrial assembly protein [Shewanella aestuarii]